jgi:DNA-binding transcriptional ArsR family regulator
MTKRPRNIYSNYGLVLANLAQTPRTTLRQIAHAVDLTERATYQIIRELETDGLIEKRRVGRQNHYHVMATFPGYPSFPAYQHGPEHDRTLKLLTPEGEPGTFFHLPGHSRTRNEGIERNAPVCAGKHRTGAL